MNPWLAFFGGYLCGAFAGGFCLWLNRDWLWHRLRDQLTADGWRIVQTETLHGAELDHDGLEVARIDQEWNP